MGAQDFGASPQEWRHTYPAIPESVPEVRAALARFTQQYAGALFSIGEVVALAASEAATNVVMHAYPDSAQPGHLDVIAAFAGKELVVTVRDAGAGLRPRSSSPGLGLGLAVIARTADRFDLLESPTGGVEVRMYFALPPPGPG